MSRFAASLHWVCVTAWVGGLWAVGYLVAPALFHHLPDRALAGTLAGHLFAYLAYAGLACGLYLIVYRLAAVGLGALRQGFFWIVVLMLVLTLAGQFGVQPLLSALRQQAMPRQVMESLFRDRFVMWHGVASILFLLQSLFGLGLVLLQRRVI